MKRTLVALAALTLAIAAAACSGGSKSKSPSFASGDYVYTASAATPDECWASLAVFPPVGIGLPFVVTTSSSSGDATVTLAPQAGIANILPTLTGARTASFVVTSGMGMVVVGSSCTLALRASADGPITADDRADLTFTATLSSMTTASNGLPSRCAAYQDTTFHGIPFPTLNAPTNGTCSFGYVGILTR